MGMSQWGAHGLAEEGVSYRDILAHYYTGTTVGLVDDSGPIEVGVAWAQPKVVATGSFRIVDGRGRTVVDRAIGSWTFDWESAGVVSIDPPAGYRLPLRVGIVDAPPRAEAGEPIPFEITLSRPAEVKTITESEGDSAGSQTEIRDAGSRKITWQAPREPGEYKVKISASSGDVVRNSEEVRIVVSQREPAGPGAGAAEADTAPPEQPEPSATVPLIVVGITLAMALVVIFRTVSMKR